MSKTLRILLIAGHGAGDPGACSNYGTEAVETRRVVNELKSIFNGYEVVVDVYPINRNAYADIGNGTLQVNFANYDYVLEVHFNSAANVAATGVEVWVTPIENGITVEQSIANKIASLGYLNRGVKREDFAVIRSAKNKGVSSALVEVCFISNQGDMSRYNSNFTNVCKAIVEGVTEGFGISKKNSYVEAKPQPAPKPTENPKVNYYVKTSAGKQLGAFNVLENAKNMASSNKATVYDASGKVIVSYAASNKKYLNLKPHMQKWAIYNQSGPYTTAYKIGDVKPAQFGGLSYEILGNPATDVYVIKTTDFAKNNGGKVAIWAPRDNDSTITNNPIY